MALSDFKRAERFGWCSHGGVFPDDCPDKGVLELHGHLVCFRHALAAALLGEPEARQMAEAILTDKEAAR